MRLEIIHRELGGTAARSAEQKAAGIAAIIACYRSVLRVIDLRDAEQRDTPTLASPS